LTRPDRIKKKKSLRKAHKGTNFKLVQPRSGFKRVKIGDRYVLVKMSSDEKNTKKKVGHKLGVAHLR